MRRYTVAFADSEVKTDDDWDIFQDRVRNTNAREIRVAVAGEQQQDHEVPHGRRPLNTANGNDGQSIYSTNTNKTTTNPFVALSNARAGASFYDAAQILLRKVRNSRQSALNPPHRFVRA